MISTLDDNISGGCLQLLGACRGWRCACACAHAVRRPLRIALVRPDLAALLASPNLPLWATPWRLFEPSQGPRPAVQSWVAPAAPGAGRSGAPPTQGGVCPTLRHVGQALARCRADLSGTLHTTSAGQPGGTTRIEQGKTHRLPP